MILARARQVRRQNWRMMLDSCVGNDAAQYAALHRMPMTEVLPRIERWLDDMYRAQQAFKKMPRRG